jgi:hypothetical protein
MALLDYEKKEGLQYGTIGDECYHCRRNRNPEEVYEPASLDRQLVYKIKIYGNEYCLCKNCFLKTLGDYVLLEPTMINGEQLTGFEFNEEEHEKSIEEEKIKKATAKKQSNKKEGEEK